MERLSPSTAGDTRGPDPSPDRVSALEFYQGFMIIYEVQRTALHADERTGLTDLLSQLQQPHLGGDIPVIGIQLADLVPHSFLRRGTLTLQILLRRVAPKLHGPETRRRGCRAQEPPCFHSSPRA
jgi:hypothetical protein